MSLQPERRKMFEKYPYIVAWGKMLGSYGYYIYDQCLKAEMDKAPSNALYCREGISSLPKDRIWETLETIQNKALIPELEAYKNGHKGTNVTLPW